MPPKNHLTKYALPLLIILLASLAVNAYQVTQYSAVTQNLVLARTEFASSTIDFGNKLKSIQTELGQVRTENEQLKQNLNDERARNNDFENKIENITDKVGVLDKLSKTDPQLLQKYSKVYFLNENYAPAKLMEIDSQYLYGEDKVKQIHASVWPFLENLLREARMKGIDLKIISAYRSFGEQTSLKSGYKVTYGAGTANQFSADQGYSEHQLGTAIDFTTASNGATFKNFENSEAYKWLLARASEYGFTLSYPENNGYYQFEPWHWRFVGVTLAKKLQRDNNHFYDLDQRVLNTHLVNLFE